MVKMFAFYWTTTNSKFTCSVVLAWESNDIEDEMDFFRLLSSSSGWPFRIFILLAKITCILAGQRVILAYA